MLTPLKSRPPVPASGGSGRQPLYYWVDHTVRFASNTGVQRVTRLLARALIEAGERLLFVCWDPKRRRLRSLRREELENLSRHGGPELRERLTEGPCPERPLEGSWLIVPEVPHITFHETPPTAPLLDLAVRTGLRTAWVFYDAVPICFGGYGSLRPAHEAYVRELQRADLVFPISSYSGEQLAGLWPAEADRRAIRVHALPGEFVESPRALRHEEPGEPGIRILSVGSIEPRKNHLALLAAFDRLCLEGSSFKPTLEIFGNLSEDLAAAVYWHVRRNPRIRYRGYDSDREVADAYRRAHFTVFPSLSEGFGLPILESLWHGKPCICAGFGAMGEAASGGGCLTVDTHFAAEIHGAMLRFARDPGLRRQLGEEAVSRPIKTWAQYAREIAGELRPVDATVRLG